jgi:hypothetical protein
MIFSLHQISDKVIFRKKFMDRVIEKKTWTTKRILTIGGIAALAALIAAAIYFTSGQKPFECGHRTDHYPGN